MVLAGNFGCGLNSNRGEIFALGSGRFERNALVARWPGLGFLVMANYKASGGEPLALRVALRGWNGFGIKLHLGPLRFILALFLLGALTAAQTPLPNAHAHNDYLHQRPLLDALDRGFCSVEADIHLVDGKLLVAHDPDQVQSGRTLEALYLEPLKARVQKHRGNVYANGGDFFLLIDLKTAAEPTYAVLRDTLRNYETMLSEFGPDTSRRRAVTVVISGNRPITGMSNETSRLAGVDGRLTDLEAKASPKLFPWISDNWTKHFQWRGEGPLSPAEKEKLGKVVRKCHEQGHKLRFWATPDTPAAWRELQLAGVDFINTDDLSGLQKFLSTPALQ